ncbi:hypothetical protein H8356DRAFT_954627 [Neocallimastix lanati (nom. inval.)]|uniref:Uncharacterized protein n=1 Tax=Neocallimastix californiae TaxID=1754190 RepID=A0A1Y2DBN3_9FUNG|nr:hypothetical protein H8356DRAFT_954627 [Neocallimastix sp. JGI-2020a]ORY56526.1 hypothetical protein LY90DRAFT_506782 [Neocallimastix californiae]|eukprot:ORY56526.1 hypothetical protein LY90DRAFT_506782 [Neocallimastix californiae]
MIKRIYYILFLFILLRTIKCAEKEFLKPEDIVCQRLHSNHCELPFTIDREQYKDCLICNDGKSLKCKNINTSKPHIKFDLLVYEKSENCSYDTCGNEDINSTMFYYNPYDYDILNNIESNSEESILSDAPTSNLNSHEYTLTPIKNINSQNFFRFNALTHIFTVDYKSKSKDSSCTV